MEDRDSYLQQLMEIPVTDFELSVRSRNCLRNMNIRTLGDLTRTTEAALLASKNFGETSLSEIKEMMTSKNLWLGMALEGGSQAAASAIDEPESLSAEDRAMLAQLAQSSDVRNPFVYDRFWSGPSRGVDPAQAEYLRRVRLLEVEHEQRRRYAMAEHDKNTEYAKIEHARRMQVIEAEAALVEEKRRRLAEEIPQVLESQETTMADSPKPASLETIREALIYHLGTPVAAAAWLNSPDTGYPTTAMDAIRAGHADVVMADLEQQWGPSPCYA